jgi:hypothetical protein
MHRAARGSFRLALLLFLAATTVGWADEKSPAYAPVAPPQALARALKINFDQVERWCDENDLASAAQFSQSTFLLASFLAQHATDNAKPHADRLVAANSKVVSAARAKNMERTRSELATAHGAIPSLIETLPGSKPEWSKFKAPGTSSAWMRLLDAGYADAKVSRKVDDFEALVLTLAEEANVLAYVKSDPRWREMSFGVRDAALASAKECRQDLEKARKTLRQVYPRCESCHQAYRR